MFHKFLRLEQSPERRVDTERLEEVFGDKQARNRERLVPSNELEVVRPGKGEVAAHRLEGVILLLEVLSCIGGVRSSGFAGLRIFLHDSDELFRIGEWEGTQQNRVYETEDCDITAMPSARISTAMLVKP